MVYVFGGNDAIGAKSGSIETLNALDLVLFNRQVEWVPTGNRSSLARLFSLFAYIGENEVVVMGGSAAEFMGDVQVINTQTKHVTCL